MTTICASCIVPPHKATDRSKLAGLMRALRRGDAVNPVVVCGEQAVTGSHRTEAARRTGRDLPVVEINDMDYRRAAWVAGVEIHSENFNGFCAALMAVSGDPEVRAALADQTDNEWVDKERVEEALEMSLEDLLAARGW